MAKINKNELKLFGIFALVIMCAFLFLVLLNYIIVILGDDIKTINFAMVQEDIIISNNLSFPFYDVDDYVLKYPIYTDYVDFRKKIYSKDIYEFAEYMKNHYYYEEETYDCKYYTYLWIDYWKWNKDKYDWKVKIVTTDNHVSPIIYNESHIYHIQYYEIMEFVAQ